MPTATATKRNAPSAELAKLEQKRDKAHAAIQSVKRERDAFDRGTETLAAEYSAFVAGRPEDWRDVGRIPKPGTPSAKLEAELKRRNAEPNPHADAFAAALADFHGADEALQRFRTLRMFDLIAEREADFHATSEKWQKALHSLIEADDEYQADVEHVRGLIVNCPGIDGQALTHDPRPAELARLARDVLDGDLARPGLTPAAAWTLQTHGAEWDLHHG